MQLTTITDTHLLDQVVCVITLVRFAVNRHAVLVEPECELQRLRPDATAVVAAGTQLVSDVVEYLEIFDVVVDTELWRMVELRFLSCEQGRSILVSEFRRGPESQCQYKYEGSCA